MAENKVAEQSPFTADELEEIALIEEEAVTPEGVRSERVRRQKIRGQRRGGDTNDTGRHSCTQPLNRRCWDCAFCGDRSGCIEPVDGYGNPIKAPPVM